MEYYTALRRQSKIQAQYEWLFQQHNAEQKKPATKRMLCRIPLCELKSRYTSLRGWILSRVEPVGSVVVSADSSAPSAELRQFGCVNLLHSLRLRFVNLALCVSHPKAIKKKRMWILPAWLQSFLPSFLLPPFLPFPTALLSLSFPRKSLHRTNFYESQEETVLPFMHLVKAESWTLLFLPLPVTNLEQESHSPYKGSPHGPPGEDFIRVTNHHYILDSEVAICFWRALFIFKEHEHLPLKIEHKYFFNEVDFFSHGCIMYKRLTKLNK